MQLSSILVALDYPNSSGLLDLAVDLAHKTGAELKALYVEDIAWFEASRFSFTRQISSYKGEVLPFTEKDIIKQSQACQARLKKLFTSYSESLKVKYSYQSVRGSMKDELLKAAAGVDLVVVRRTGRMVEKGQKLGESARSLALESTAPVLIWQNDNKWPRTAIGICSTPEESENIVRWSFLLADAEELNIRLFWPDDFDFSDEWARDVISGNLAAKPFRVFIQDISEVHPVLSAEDLKYFHNAFFIMQRSDLQPSVNKFLNKLSNSVLLL